MNCGNGGSLNITDAITIAVWVKWNQFKNYGVIIQKGSGGATATFNYGIWSYASGYVSELIANGTSDQGVGVTLSDTNKWYFIVFKFDSSFLYFYLDGVEKTKTSQTIIPKVNTYPVVISLQNYCLDGFIDDVRIYNRALSPGEIQYLYTKTQARYK